MEKMLRIQATTINEIIDAIEASGYVTIRIRLSHPSAEEHAIEREILEKVSDEVRAFEGTTDKILIKNLAERILSNAEEPDVPDDPDDPDAPTIVKLDTPVIALYDDTTGEPDVDPVIIKLDTPVIDLYDDTTGEPDVDPVIIKLDTPVIDLYDDTTGEPDVPDVPDVPDDPVIIKLATSVIRLYDESVIEKLDTPVIQLYEKLETSVIELYDEGSNTSAILGEAILGFAILGDDG